jgi:hypothetical protein
MGLRSPPAFRLDASRAGTCQSFRQAGAVNSTSRSRCRTAKSSSSFATRPNYITALPAKEAALPEWQAAIEALILVVELGGPTMFARIGVMRALNRHHVREFNPKRKEPRWGRRKLKRDV